MYTGMVHLYLQKAFDTVDHNILCNKLKPMGVRSTKWLDLTLVIEVNWSILGKLIQTKKL